MKMTDPVVNCQKHRLGLCLAIPSIYTNNGMADIELRIPVKVATQSTGKRPPKPVKVATSSERSDARSLFLLYLVSCRQMSLFFRSDSPSNFIL